MSMTRRKLLAHAACCSSGLLFARLGWAQQGSPSIAADDLASDAERPQFHLLPAHNWMNDPNGPIFYKGRYHLFFQYNPQAAVWGNMSWNHATSTDLLHWRHEPLALTESAGGPDAAGCFSGSCVEREENGRKRVYAFYTGVIKDPAHATIKADGLKETQCLAWSDDDLLRTWTKQAEPIIAAPPPGLTVTGFRDPAVWERNGAWYMTVGSGIAGKGGCVLLYRATQSTQLHGVRGWEYQHLLAGGKSSRASAKDPVDNGDMWECPDFFPLDGGHVLIYSTLRKVYWQSGVLDESALTFTPKCDGMLDLDAFYAPKTQLDAHGRRILWGWIPERRPDAAMVRAGWSGMMSLPRVLSLDADGTLRQRVLPEATMLRGAALQVNAASSGVLLKASGEFLLHGDRTRDFVLRIMHDSTSLLEVKYDAATHCMHVHGAEVQLRSEDAPTLHGFVDCSVLELIVADRVGCTQRFYLGSAVAPNLIISAPGERLQLFSVNPISPNRLTARVA